MLKAILKRRWRDEISGATGEAFYTLDFRCDALEEQLRRGRMSQNGFEIVELTGVELMPDLESDYDNAPTDPHHGGKVWTR
jgi:hypothetical protein